MIFTFLIIGIIATMIGALPPGASNIAVVKTTVQEDICQSLKIGYGAGIGEVMLALIAFSSGMVVQEFFTMHLWVQGLVAGVLAMAGLYFIINRKKEKKESKKYGSKYLTGFALSVINPPVLVYWVLVFSILRSSFNLDGGYSVSLMLFFVGVFLGKVLILYAYGKLVNRIQKTKPQSGTSMNKMIGVILISLSVIQTAKLVLF